MSIEQVKTSVVVVGAGPGGYPAAFHAADMGMDVVLVDKEDNPGGVCLYRGCIPSKAILHAAGAIQSAKEAEELGISFGAPKIDLSKLQDWKKGVVSKLTGGLGALTRQRKIKYIKGEASFISSNTLQVETDKGRVEVTFDHAIISTGSIPIRPGAIPDSQLIMDSTNALEIESIPQRMLVMGGGYIGLELGQAYSVLGCEVSVVEMKASLLPGIEPKLVKPLSETINRQFSKVMLNTRVVEMKEESGSISVTFENQKAEQFSESYDKVLIAVGRRPVTDGLGLENTQVELDDNGFIKVNEQRFSTDPKIQAIGDIAGNPLLAHKATHEGRIAAEALHDGKVLYSPRAIPAVIYTDPEIAWCGLTESEAARQGLNVKVGSFPWAASGRYATLNRSDGLTTVVTDATTGRVLGIGIVGAGAGELIGEGVLAMEMGAVAEDLAMTIHAHPSLSETVMEAAENAMGTSTHFFQRN